MADPNTLTPLAALRRLFDAALAAGDAVLFSLPGGAPLFLAGEPADQLYLLRAGRLAALGASAEGEPRSVGIIRPGDSPGLISDGSACSIRGFHHTS